MRLFLVLIVAAFVVANAHRGLDKPSTTVKYPPMDPAKAKAIVKSFMAGFLKAVENKRLWNLSKFVLLHGKMEHNCDMIENGEMLLIAISKAEKVTFHDVSVDEEANMHEIKIHFPKVEGIKVKSMDLIISDLWRDIPQQLVQQSDIDIESLPDHAWKVVSGTFRC